MSKSPNEIKTRYEKRPTQSSSQSTAVNHGKFLVINSFDPKYIEIYTQISTAWYEIVIQIQIKIKISSKKIARNAKIRIFGCSQLTKLYILNINFQISSKITEFVGLDGQNPKYQTKRKVTYPFLVFKLFKLVLFAANLSLKITN